MQLAGIAHRLSLLEAGFSRLDAHWQRSLADARRRQEALRVAKELRLSVNVLRPGAAAADHRSMTERRALALALRQRKWSYQQMAHLMGCSERTIERYLAKECPDTLTGEA